MKKKNRRTPWKPVIHIEARLFAVQRQGEYPTGKITWHKCLENKRQKAKLFFHQANTQRTPNPKSFSPSEHIQQQIWKNLNLWENFLPNPALVPTCETTKILWFKCPTVQKVQKSQRRMMLPFVVLHTHTHTKTTNNSFRASMLWPKKQERLQTTHKCS